DVLQAAMLILGAPLVRGIIARLKAHLQRRRGASIWRPYVELFKLLRKEDLVPPTSSAVFRLAPLALFAATICMSAFVPVVHASALLGSRGDFFLLVYLLALGRFFLRSEEHTSELQSRGHLVCRLLLEKKKMYSSHMIILN